MAHYGQRNITAKLIEMMRAFPAVAIIGSRQVGKTTLAKTIGHHFTYVDLEKPSDYDRVTRDPEFFLKQTPLLIVISHACFLNSIKWLFDASSPCWVNFRARRLIKVI